MWWKAGVKGVRKDNEQGLVPCATKRKTGPTCWVLRHQTWRDEILDQSFGNMDA
jgi:hypothetical protein